MRNTYIIVMFSHMVNDNIGFPRFYIRSQRPVSNATIRVCIQTETEPPMRESKKMNRDVALCYNIG